MHMHKTCSPSLRPAQRGFTLIELMVVAAIVAVLAALAYPSYSEFVAQSRRAAMMAELAQGQQWMERFYTENFSYHQVRGSTTLAADLFPMSLQQSPAPGEGIAHYTLAITVDARQPDAYMLQATRAGGMAGDRCGDYRIDQYGRKTLENYDSHRFATAKLAMAYCWK